MDRKYGRVRHVYDLTRKYFLFGRDRAIGVVGRNSPDIILEIGCGTGRNLELLAAANPTARVYGIDISREMLKSAISRTANLPSVRVAMADACAFDPREVFGFVTADAVLMSFSLSMIPNPRAALVRAIETLGPGGTLVVVDFGDFAGFGPLGGLTKRSLRAADAPPVENLGGMIEDCLRETGDCNATTTMYLGGYYVLATVTRTG
jgi:S-adenosylmethionine-diacylgycerolhomoserine-N-methlytransferase